MTHLRRQCSQRPLLLSRWLQCAVVCAERSFRWLAHGAHTGVVRGDGPRAAMAAAVLERVGYRVAPAGATNYDVSIELSEGGKRASINNGVHHGADFASLAMFLRQRSSGT